MKESTKGAFAIFFTYVFWGMMPFYWRALIAVSSAEVVAHRIIWACLLSFLLIAASHKVSSVVSLFGSNRRALVPLVFSSVALTINWGAYVWAVNNDRMLEVSLGYFINPLVSILFGVVFFKERLNKIQWLAIGIAAAGVCFEVVTLGHLPFVSLSLAFSFGTYGLLKKFSTVESLVGFTVETMFLTPFALIWLVWLQRSGVAHFPYDAWTTLLLVGTGVITSAPFIIFAWGVKRSALTTVGLIQYASPILVLLIGVFVYHEPVSSMRLLSFILIWTAIIIFTAESFWRTKNPAFKQTAK